MVLFFVMTCLLHAVSILQRLHPHFISKPPCSGLLCSANDMNWDPRSAPKLDFNEDFYSILEVPSDIEPSALKKCYYKLVFRYHPDNKPSSEEKILCNRQMMVINAAYKTLKDPIARAKYDQKRAIKGESKYRNTASSFTTSSEAPKAERANATPGTRTDSWNYQQQQQQSEMETMESLSDVLTDLLKEAVTVGGRKGLFEDLVSFLEGGGDGGTGQTDWLDASQMKSLRLTLAKLKVLVHYEGVESYLLTSTGACRRTRGLHH